MEYQMFKGLQRPLEFMGLQGRYITWAAVTAGVGILGFMLVYALVGFLVALAFAAVSSPRLSPSLRIRSTTRLSFSTACANVKSCMTKTKSFITTLRTKRSQWLSTVRCSRRLRRLSWSLCLRLSALFRCATSRFRFCSVCLQVRTRRCSLRRRCGLRCRTVFWSIAQNNMQNTKQWNNWKSPLLEGFFIHFYEKWR